MSLYTSQYLKNVYQNRFTSLNEDIRTRTFSASENSSFDIFLSHSFLDKEEVLGLYWILKNKGYKVYVDWIVDPHLDRNNVTKESAELIRKRLRNSKSLLLAVSHNAGMSKWMPWELGYVDGHTSKCAIAPVSKDNLQRHSYKGVEYLALYPYIDQELISGIEKIYISEDGRASITINDWISKVTTTQGVKFF